MYRIQDFHSSRAPPLESGQPQFPLRGRFQFSSGEPDDGGGGGGDPFASLVQETSLHLTADAEGGDGASTGPGALSLSGAGGAGSAAAAAKAAFDYEGGAQDLVVVVGEERIVLDDVTAANEDGWTALMACCHSHLAVSAGLAIIDSLRLKKGPRDAKTTLELRTRRGPGSGNEGWTALHMAAA